MMRFCAASHEQAKHLSASTPEYGTSGASRSRPSWAYTELLCYRLSCTAARLGLATGGIPRNWTSSTCTAFAKFSVSAGRNMCQTRRSFARLSSLALKPCWTRHSFNGHDMSLAWTTADSQNNCSMLSSQLVNSTKAGRGSGTKTCWNRTSRPATSQLTSGKPWPQDRPAWRAATRKGTKHFERSQLQSLDDKRSARKNRVPNPSTAVPCQLCGKICASTFGLQAHMRKHQHWRVIFVFKGLLLYIYYA